jgi:DNA-binding XRE family transcriptional regulator
MPRPKRGPHIVLMAKTKEIRVAKARAGVTYKELADAIGETRWQMEHALRGHQKANRYAEKVADFFEMPVEQLFLAIDLENPDRAVAA